MAKVKNIEWSRQDLISYVSNQSAYVAQSLSMGGEVAFDATTLTNDNRATLLDEKIADAINALVPHFYRIIGDTAEVKVEETVGFSFTPRIEGGSYSQAEFSHIKTLCKKLVASYILTDWYSLKGIAPMSGYFATQHKQTSTELDVALDRLVRPVRRSGVSIRSVSDNGEPSKQQVLWMGEKAEVEAFVEPFNDTTLNKHSFTVKVYTDPSNIVEIGRQDYWPKGDNGVGFVLDTEDVGVGTVVCIITILLTDTPNVVEHRICKIISDINVREL